LEDLSSLFAVVPRLHVLVQPPEPASGYDYTAEIKEFVKSNRTLSGNLAIVHANVWGQCSNAMKARIKSSNYHEVRMLANHCLWLFQEERSVTLQFEQSQNPYVSLFDEKASFYPQLRAWVDEIKYHGGTVGKISPSRCRHQRGWFPTFGSQAPRHSTWSYLGIAILRGAVPTRHNHH
jgi:hypothetical protein